MLRDLRLAVRTLAKQPAFTTLAVVTFALGIGADTAIFTVADATLQRSLPFPEPGKLLSITQTQKGGDWMPYSVSYPNFRDWQAQQTSFTALAGMSENGFAVRRGEGSELEVVATVSSTFFKVLEQPVARGRTFDAADEEPHSADVLIVTHAYWQTQLGGDPAVVGRVLTLNEKPYTVVGVLPRGYAFGPLDNLGLYAPLKPEGDMRERRNLRWLGVVGRLRPGVSRTAATAEIDGLAARLAVAYPDTGENLQTLVKPLDEVVLGKVRPIIFVLLFAVGLVLIVACANVANLALARATSRRRELAIRAALGASRGRIIGELAAESVVTALAGGALGLVLAMWGVDVLVGIIPRRMVNAMPWLIGLRIDAFALGFAFVLALVVGVIVGIVPGLAASRHDLQAILGEEARTTPGRARARLSDFLVAAEVALAFTLVVGAALFGRSLLAMTHVDPGLDTRDALTVRLALSESKHKDDPALVAGQAELLRRLETVPGVRGAASIGVLPLTGAHQTVNYLVAGRPRRGNDAAEANIREVSPNYFQVAGVALRSGRTFGTADGPNAPHVVIVNEALAAREFPGEDAVGKSLVYTFKEGLAPMPIVGVVADQRTGLDERTPPAIYETYAQSPDNYLSLFLRISGDAGPIALAVRHEIAQLRPGDRHPRRHDDGGAGVALAVRFRAPLPGHPGRRLRRARGHPRRRRALRRADARGRPAPARDRHPPRGRRIGAPHRPARPRARPRASSVPASPPAPSSPSRARASCATCSTESARTIR